MDQPRWVTYQSVEAHVSTANRPLRTLCTVSWGTSGLSKKPITCFITPASRRINPITTHHSKQPASINMWRRYLKDTQLFPFSAGCGETIKDGGSVAASHLSCTCDLWGPLLASSMEMCSSSAWLRLRVEEFSSTMVQSPSTTELDSVRSVAEPTLYSSTRRRR